MVTSLNVLKPYLYGLAAAVLLFLCSVIAIQHNKIEYRNLKIKNEETELSISNQSITDVTKALKDVGNQLHQKELDDTAKQATIKANLVKIAEQDRTLEDIESRLKARKSVSNCPIPKDLQDAWNSL